VSGLEILLGGLITLVFLGIGSLVFHRATNVNERISDTKVQAVIILVVSLIPRLFFIPYAYQPTATAVFPESFHQDFWGVFWHSNFETAFMMLITYFLGFLSFGTNHYQLIAAIVTTLATALLGQRILRALNCPLFMTLAIPILFSLLRICPEFMWLDHHDGFIILFNAWFILAGLTFFKQPHRKNLVIFALASLALLWINPVNFLIFPPFFVLYGVVSKLKGSQVHFRSSIILTLVMVSGICLQCLKTYVGIGLFAPTGMGSQLFALNMYIDFEKRPPGDLDALFSKAQVPEWYRKCAYTTPGGGITSAWHKSFGQCFTQFESQSGQCRGPNYQFTLDHVVSESDINIRQLLKEDVAFACSRPMAVSGTFPEVSSKFGVEYQRVNSQLVKIWFLSDPVAMIKHGIFHNFVLFELKGSAALNRNFFVPMLESIHDLSRIQPYLNWIAGIGSSFIMMLVLVFYLGGFAFVVLQTYKLRTLTFAQYFAARDLPIIMIFALAALIKIAAIILYCFVTGGEGERYWQYYIWNIVVCDMMLFNLFLPWKNVKGKSVRSLL
jgi:hypothetical protein